MSKPKEDAQTAQIEVIEQGRGASGGIVTVQAPDKPEEKK